MIPQAEGYAAARRPASIAAIRPTPYTKFSRGLRPHSIALTEARHGTLPSTSFQADVAPGASRPLTAAIGNGAACDV
jgi:hypothetical protein